MYYSKEVVQKILDKNNGFTDLSYVPKYNIKKGRSYYKIKNGKMYKYIIGYGQPIECGFEEIVKALMDRRDGLEF